jgi:hypothetical protein
LILKTLLTIGDVLRGNGIKQLRTNGDAQVSEVTKELSGSAKALVDFKGAINIWIVNEALPADGSTRFL